MGDLNKESQENSVIDFANLNDTLDASESSDEGENVQKKERSKQRKRKTLKADDEAIQQKRPKIDSDNIERRSRRKETDS